jgi:hypothetical protein
MRRESYKKFVVFVVIHTVEYGLGLFHHDDEDGERCEVDDRVDEVEHALLAEAVGEELVSLQIHNLFELRRLLSG